MCAFASPHHHTLMLSHVAKGQADPVLIVTISLLSHVAKGQAISVLIIFLTKFTKEQAVQSSLSQSPC